MPVGETGYLTARYPGRDRKAKPLVVIGHMDVVEANPADWERDPFTPIIEGGYIFGRGTNDMKGDLAMIVAAAIDLRRKGWVPAHDVVLAFSGDEETAMATTKAMAQALSGAGLVLNGDAGGGELDKDGKAYVYSIQAGEKDLCRLHPDADRSRRSFQPPGRDQFDRGDGHRAGESVGQPLRAAGQPADQGLSRRHRAARAR
ncbi:M20/M25/M40 family metallo-hydrolase [Novosphingobium colocasiae]